MKVGVLIVGILVVGCGDDGASPATTLAAEPESVVLSITGEGGFVPVEFNLDRMPTYVLTSDRKLYFPGPIPEIFPGPLYPNVQVTRIDEDLWDEIFGLVDDIGLPDVNGEVIDDAGADMVADASTEFLNYYVDGEVKRMGFYALGLTLGGESTERLLAGELVQIVAEATAISESEEYVPTRLQVAAGPGFMEEPLPTTVPPEPWPLEVAFADMTEWQQGWRCVEIDGDSVDELVSAFKAANQTTRWDSGSEEVAIKARPLFPGEAACGVIPAA